MSNLRLVKTADYGTDANMVGHDRMQEGNMAHFGCIMKKI
jgi:hypothetical protein